MIVNIICFLLQKSLLFSSMFSGEIFKGFHQRVPYSELPPSKEQLELAVAAITLSGPSGTGKTSAAKILEQRIFETTETNIVFIKAGELFREKIKQISGQEMLAYAERDFEADKWIDDIQADRIRGASLQNPLLLEGRLAGVIAREQKNKMPDLSVVSILFTARPSTRYLRILKREKADHLNLTFKDIRRLTTEREKGDLARWREMHPQLKGVNPFSPANYDLAVDTGQLTPEGVADFIINWFVENGYLIKRNPLPPQATIFQSA